MRYPEVSVVMGTRNAARYLDEALASILEGTFDDLEIVVVDCASEDGSAEIARRRGARVIEQEGTGLFAGWNQGVEAASGELIAFLDSDDRWVPEKLESQVARLRERPDLDYVIGRARHFLEPGFPPPPGMRPEILDQTLPAPMPGTLLARRRVFDLIGPFRTEYEIASDVDWFARLKDADLRHEVVPEAVVHKRLHDSNLSHFQADSMNAEIVELLRESIRRKRESA
jgi:glycosyltransferase involved in cell wall biosynthesis